MKFPHFRIVLCVLALLVVGCDSKKSASRSSESGKPNTTGKRTPSDAPVSTRRAAANAKPFVVETLLKWKNLPEELRSALHARQSKGLNEIKQGAFRIMRTQFDVMFAIEQFEAADWQPVLASNPLVEASQPYSKQKVALDDRVERLVKFHSSGVDHFVSLKFEGVSEEKKKRVDQLVRSVYSNLYQKSEPGFWDDAWKELTRFHSSHDGLNKDPLLTYCLGCADRALKKLEPADKNFYYATLYLLESDYPARFAVDVHEAYVRSERSLVAKMNPASRLAKYCLSIVYWLEHDFRATPAEHRNAYALVNQLIVECKTQGKWDLLTKFMKELAANKQLPTWLRATCRARICSELAWHWRGNGYANTVPKASWKPFEQYQKIAAEEYQRAYNANPLFPEPAARLIGISMTGHNDQSEDYWFEKAIEAEVDHMPAYRSKMISLLPQWGGSVQEMFEFAKLHADKEQYDTHVPMLLVDFRHMVLRNVTSPEQREFLDKPEVVKATIKAIEGMMASRTAHPNSSVLLDDIYYLTLKAIVATKGQLYDVARESFDSMGGKFSPQATGDLQVGAIGLLRGKAYAMSSDHADECKEMLDIATAAGDDMSAEQKAEIVDRCSALIDKIDQEHAVNWLSTIRDKLQFESDFAVGMMANLTFDEELSFWVCGDKSQFKSESADSILIDTTKSTKPMSLTSLVDAKGDAKIIEFDITFAKETENRKAAAHFTPTASVMNYRGAAFVFGLNRLYRKRRRRTNVGYELGQFSFGWKNGEGNLYFYYTDINIDSNRVRLKITPGYFEAYLNDRFICRSASERILGALDTFQICQPRSRKGRGIAKVSGIRIENWYGTAPPIRQGTKKLVEYYKQDFDEDPTDKWASFWYAQATHLAGDTEAAIELYLTAIENGMAKHIAAFFVGDCHDLQGDSAEALRWYKIAADAKVEDVTEMYKRTDSQEYSNSCHWASARLSWLMYSSPNEATRSSLNAKEFARVGSEDKHVWVVKLFPAMEHAKAGDFDKALKIGRSLISKCSLKDKPILDTVLDAWAAGEEYRWKEGDTPLYLELDDPIPFFRCFEDYLAPAWKGVY